MPAGRPTKYSKKLVSKIIKRMTVGESVRSICRDPDMPALSTVMDWLWDHKEFSEQYDRAMEQRAVAWAEEIIEIADDGTNDLMTITKGNTTYNVEDKEVTNRSKLRVESRKWLMSKLQPKRYGDRVDVTSGGEKIQTAPLVISDIPARNVDTQNEATESD